MVNFLLNIKNKSTQNTVVADKSGYKILNATRKISVGQNGGFFKMSKSRIVVPEAKKAMENFKMEAANEVGVNLKQGYNGDLTSKQAGSIGGQMVKKMIEDYENKIK